MKEITVKDVVVELQKRFLGEFTVYLYSMPNEEKDFVDAILLTKKWQMLMARCIRKGLSLALILIIRKLLPPVLKRSWMRWNNVFARSSIL